VLPGLVEVSTGRSNTLVDQADVATFAIFFFLHFRACFLLYVCGGVR
jgi:hypothetical protein